MHAQRLRIRIGLVFVVLLAVVAVSAQQAPAPAPAMRGDGPAPQPKPFSITRSDPGAGCDRLPQRQGRGAGRGFGLNEGPVWVREGNSGYLLVGGLLDNVIYKIAADNTVSVFMEKAGYTGTDVEPHRHADPQRPVARAADWPQLRQPGLAGARDLVRRQRSHGDAPGEGRHPDGAVGRLERQALQRPERHRRDVADDAVYLTDNDFGLRDGGQNPDKQMPNGIWLIKDGQSRMVLDATVLGGIPNGIALSPDEHYLYANAGAADHALRGAAGRRARSGQPVHAGSRHRRRHEGGHARQPLLDQRCRTRDRPDHRARPGRCSAISTCPSSAASPSGRSARPTWRSATPTRRASTSPPATRCIASDSRWRG